MSESVDDVVVRLLSYHAEQVANYTALPTISEKDLATVRWHNNKLRAALTAIGNTVQEQGWRDIADAPKDGTPVLVKLRADVFPGLRPQREDLEPWNGITAVMRSRGDVSAWCFAAPVGQGGFPDEWMIGWQPLPDPPVEGGGE